MIEFSLAANWISTLGKHLVDNTVENRREIDEIADRLLVSPRDLAPSFVEPFVQPFNPIDELDDAEELFTVEVFKYLQKFVSNKSDKKDGRHQLFLLGDAGMGKTSVLAMFKLAHAERFWPGGYDCIAMKLGENTLKELRRINKRSKTVLLLDSLDEDRTAFDDVKSTILELLKETQNFHKVVITCRTQFFPKTDQATFQRQDRVKIGGFTCPVKYLSLFNEMQIDKYLEQKFDRKEDRARAGKIVRRMDDLRCRPMLLAYVDDLLDEPLINRNTYNIYETLTNSWLERECRKPKVEIDPKDLLQACQYLAVTMTSLGLREIARDKLQELTVERPELKSISMVEIGGRSILNKNSDDDFRFAHQSFQEYLAIRALQDGYQWNYEVTSEMMARFIIDADWTNANLKGAKLSGCSLDKVNFDKVMLTNADFSHCTLRDSRFRRADATGCSFKEVYAVNAAFRRIVAVRVDFSDADLENADFSGADLRFSNFEGASLKGANFKRAKLEGANFKKTQLNGANLVNCNVTSANFSDADLSGALFSGAEALNAKFDRCILTRTNFHSASLNSSTFSETVGSEADFENAVLVGSSFREAILEEGYFKGANLSFVDFSHATLDRSSISKATIKDSKLVAAQLINVRLGESDIGGVDFGNACLRGAILSGVKNWNEICNFNGADFAGVRNAPKGLLSWASERGADI